MGNKDIRNNQTKKYCTSSTNISIEQIQDFKALATLVNINHLMANINWLFSIDINDLLKKEHHL